MHITAPVLECVDPLGELQTDFRQRQPKVQVVTMYGAGPGLSWASAQILSDNPYHGICRYLMIVEGQFVFVFDQFPQRAAAKSASLGFQLAPDSKVTLDGIKASIEHAGGKLCLVAEDSLAPPVQLEGNRDPIGGWVSSRYGIRTAAPQLRYHLGDIRDVGILLCPAGASASHCHNISTEHDGTALQAAVLYPKSSPVLCDYVQIRRSDAETSLEADRVGDAQHVHVNGKCAFIREFRDGAFEVRAQDCRAIKVKNRILKTDSGRSIDFRAKIDANGEIHDYTSENSSNSVSTLCLD